MARPSQSTTELVNFFRAGHKYTYRKGQIILRAGEEPRGVYYIEAGLVKVYAISHDGIEHAHLFYGDHDIFPVIWAFRGAVRNVFYQAMVDTTVWVRPKEEFIDYVRDHPGAAYELLMKTTGLFRLYAGRIDNLLYSNSYEKVTCQLLALMARFGRVEGKKHVIDAPLTHQDIASSVGLTRETASRCISKLQRKGLLEYDDQRHFVIKDLNAFIKVIGRETVAGMWPGLIAMAEAEQGKSD